MPRALWGPLGGVRFLMSEVALYGIFVFRLLLEIASPDDNPPVGKGPALEATQGQHDSFFSQLPYKCYLEEVASVGD